MNKIFTLLFFLLFASASFAQMPSWAWGRNFISDNSNESKPLAIDPQGNVFVASSFSEPQITIGETTLINTSEGTSDMCLIKYNSIGDVLWVKQFAGASNDWVISLAADASGNIYLAGRFQQGIDLGNGVVVEGSHKYFLAKFNNDGNAQWAKICTGINESFYLKDIEADAAGNVYIAGHLNTPTLTFDNVVIPFPQFDWQENNTTSFVAKFNSEGVCQWGQGAQTGINHETGNKPNSLAVDTAGNVYVAGEMFNSSISFGDIVMTKPSNSYNSHMYIVKYNADGVAQWGHHTGSDSFNRISSAYAVNCTDDAVYVSGMFAGNAVFGSMQITTTGSMQLFAAKFSPSGTALWVKTPAVTINNSYSKVTHSALDAEGNLYIAGNLAGSSFDFGNGNTVDSPFGSLFAARLDNSTGEAQWVQRAGDLDINNRVYIRVANPGEIYISSLMTTPSMAFGGITLTSPENHDVFVAKLFSPPLSNASAEKANAAVWPNPVTNLITIESGSTVNSVDIYSLTGQLVYRQNIGAPNARLDISGLSAGTYILTIHANGKLQNVKLIKE